MLGNCGDNFTPLRSPTSPVGQPFAFCLGGQWFNSWGCTHSHDGTRFFLLALSCYIGDPDVIDHWLALGSAPTMGSFTRLCADDVKSQLWSHIAPSVLYSTPCRSSFSLQHSYWLEPRWSCWGGALWRPWNFIPLYSFTGPVGQLFAFWLQGQWFASQGCIHTHNGTRFLLLVLSCYTMIFCKKVTPTKHEHWMNEYNEYQHKDCTFLLFQKSAHGHSSSPIIRHYYAPSRPSRGSPFSPR